VDCNRFVDYIVAESLAQRYPTLRTQVANSHSHFRTHLTAASARSRVSPTIQPHGSHISSLQELPSTESPAPAHPPSAHPTGTVDDEESMAERWLPATCHPPRRWTADNDLESCFGPVSIRSIELLGVDPSFPTSAAAVPVFPDSIPDPFILRRLAETYDANSSSSFAHAENGSMANTVNDATHLFTYRPLKDSKVRLLDAGDHAHHPLGVGFLCVPTTDYGLPEPLCPYLSGPITLQRFHGSLSRTLRYPNILVRPVTTCRAIRMHPVSFLSHTVSVDVKMYTLLSNRLPNAAV
jgi:hypothetical protein